MKIRLSLLSMMCIFLHMAAMEQPPQTRGAKRPAAALEESESDVELAPTALSKIETSELLLKERDDLKYQLQQLAATQLPNLPLELQTRLLTFILDAPGPTQLARLYNAAENIRNYVNANKSYHDWLSSPYMTNFLIEQLARRYTKNNDVIGAAQALGTDQASRWIGQRLNETLAAAGQPQFDSALARNFDSHVAQALEHAMLDVYHLLTKYVKSVNLALRLNMMQVQGLPALNYLIYYKSYDLLNVLLNIPGINVMVFDGGHETPLHYAVRGQNALLVHRLLAFPGIRVNARNVNQSTPLMLASANGNVPIINELLSHGAAVNLLDREGKSALMRAIMNAKRDAVARLLAVPGININVQANNRATTALHEAIYSRNPEIVRMVLSAHTNPLIDVNIQDEEGAAPLHRALNADNYRELIGLLMAAGADINATDDEGKTPLMWATTLEDEAGPLRVLLGYHPNLNLRDNEGHTALWYTQESGQEPKVRLLQEAGATE